MSILYMPIPEGCSSPSCSLNLCERAPIEVDHGASDGRPGQPGLDQAVAGLAHPLGFLWAVQDLADCRCQRLRMARHDPAGVPTYHIVEADGVGQHHRDADG